MAEAPKKKPAATATTAAKKPAAKKPASGKPAAGAASAPRKTATTAAAKPHLVTETAASTKPTSAKSKAKTKTASTKKSASVKSAASKPARKASKPRREPTEAQLEAKLRRKSTFVEQFLPYILVAVCIFLGALFILDAVGGAENPDDHMMGVVGYYLCYALYGCLGWTVYLVPLFTLHLIIFWKKYLDEGVLITKAVLSAVLVVLIAAITHAGACAADADLVAAAFNPVSLYKAGAKLLGGGVVGGLIGYPLYWGLHLPGTIVVAVLTLPLLVMALIGVTPAFVFGKLGAYIKLKWEEAAEERALRREEEEAEAEAEAEAERKAAAEEKYRERRARAEEKAALVITRDPSKESDSKAEKATKGGKAAKAAEADYEQLSYEDEDLEAYDEDMEELSDEETYDEAPENIPDEEENIVVNPRTGEVVGTDRKSKFAFGKKKAAKAAAAEPAGLPFYDEAEEEDEDEAPVVEVTAAESMAAARHKPARPAYTEPADEEDEEAADTMEVGYEDDVDVPDYEIITEEDAATPARRKDHSMTVRILKSETAAVAEAGLAEEEVVISSAHTEEELPEEPAKEYTFPPVDLLTKGSSRYEANEAEIAENTRTLREVLESFHIRVKEISCACGPTITRFEVKPDSGVRVRSIANLVDDIAMGLAKAGVRIEAPIPGKAAVGIEVPNADPATVYFRNILETPEFRNHKSRIAACLGADVAGRPVILDINKMPHLLVAGTTGSGKSVCINSIIMSILYKAKPDEVKLILIDPKKVEFAVYRDLPHLYCPLISDPKKAAGALNSAVNEMERRFELIEEVGVRNLAGYNEVVAGDPTRPPMPQMVIIIDELADLMMTASNEVETAICRLAQKARAAGIHLILGTQRPSTDVITGLIKANIPSRIAFTVTQQIDSRIIIDSVGAEKLIGRGDMLYSPVGTTKPLRVQGTFVSDGEVERVITFIRENNEKGEFDESFTRQIEIEAAKCAMGNKKKGEQMSIEDFDGLGGGGAKDGEDPKFWEALDVAAGKDKIGTSALQRALNLGYGRAAKIIDRMEELGFVGPDPGTKQGRKVLITRQQLMEYRANGLPGSGGDASEGDFDEL